MGRDIKICKDYYANGVKLYKKNTAALEPGLTVLIGCNGSGKTTFLKQIKENLNEEKIPYLSFDNLYDGGSMAKSKASFYGDLTFLAQSMCSSEGENIVLNLGQFSRKIGKFLADESDKKENKELWILMDGIDSGLSIDGIVDLKKGLFDIIFEMYPNNDIYIMVTANEYELAKGEHCYDVINCKYVTIKSYERYRKLILKSRDQKGERYN